MNGEAPLRTLIVDDEPLAVERLQILCASIGSITVVGCAQDGMEGLQMAAQLAPDLALPISKRPASTALPPRARFRR